MSVRSNTRQKAALRLLCRILCLAITLGVLTTFTGCIFGDVVNKHLIGPYKLFALDHKEELQVVYERDNGLLLVIIDSVIVDVGWDDRFVVATRRPDGDPGGMLSYYYVDMAKDDGKRPEHGVVGPLTEAEFASAKEALDLPEFTLHYPELR